jgi:hypothetical protein
LSRKLGCLGDSFDGLPISFRNLGLRTSRLRSKPCLWLLWFTFAQLTFQRLDTCF